MFNYDKIRESAAAAVCAILLTATAVSAAVGPARAVETASVQYVQAQASDSANV